MKLSKKAKLVTGALLLVLLVVGAKKIHNDAYNKGKEDGEIKTLNYLTDCAQEFPILSELAETCTLIKVIEGEK